MQLRTALRVAIPTFIIITLLGLSLGKELFDATPTQADPGEETTYYLLTDHLGSVDVVLDDTGNAVERRDFLPYGSERLTDSTGTVTKTDHKFTGKELDDETGLYYYGARYFDPLIGRFVSMDPYEGDPVNPQTLNKYSYVLNNPVKYVDPTGEYEIPVHYDLTLYLSKSAGYTDAQALNIAYYNQLTDMDENSSPYNVDNGWMHFVSQDVAEMWLDSGIEDGEGVRYFGTGLHFLQDSFSHNGHGYDWFKGGHIGDSALSVLGLAKNTDKTYEYSDDAIAMAKTSLNYLRKNLKEKFGTGDLTNEDFDKQTQSIWDSIESNVEGFAKANDEEQKDYFGLSEKEKTRKDLVTEP